MFLGIAMTGAYDISMDLRSTNQITDYSFVTTPFKLGPYDAIFRCVSGLGPSGLGPSGPSGRDLNIALGGWYFKEAKIPVNTRCSGSAFDVSGAPVRRFPGVINLYQCGTFTTTEEGVYSCIMMNSSMMNQTLRVGIYFSGRSKSLDVYPFTSL